MENNLTFKTYKSLEKELEEIWKHLENYKKFYFFQKYSYIQNLVKIFDLKNIFIVVIFDKNNPIAILPLEIINNKGVRILQWLGTSQSDYCSPLLIKKDLFNQENFILIWKKIIKQINDFDIIFFNKQPEYIEDVLNPFINFFKNSRYSKVFQIQFIEKENEYLNTIKNKKFTSEFTRTRKKLLENNTIKFEHVSAINFKNLINIIISNKISFLNKRKIFHSINNIFTSFFEKLSETNTNNLMISLFKINNEIIAANLGVIQNKRFYYLLPVIFSDKFKSFSPGKLLIYELINWCKENNIAVFDFGIGEEVYKKYWSNYSINMYRYLSFKGMKGLIVYLFLRIYLKFKPIF
jgi:CelD/BcsL family acetyltransferase involved in cellulose biosynthesis